MKAIQEMLFLSQTIWDNIAEFHCWKTLGVAQSQVCASQADGKTKQSYASAISSTAHDATTDLSSNSLT